MFLLWLDIYLGELRCFNNKIKNECLKEKIIKIHLYGGTKKHDNINETRQNNEKNKILK